MLEQLPVSLCQMQSQEDIDVNLPIIETLYKQSAEEGGIVSFPENCTFIRVGDMDMRQGAFTMQHPFLEKMKGLVDAHNCALHLGGVPLVEEDQVFNATIWLEPGADPRVVYRKIHLFDVDVAGIKVRESDSYSPGETASIIDYRGWKLGFSICYDVRFSGLYAEYARNQVDLVFVPAAFLVKTGEAHWETLLRARAIESQMYVLAAAQTGEHVSLCGNKSRRSYGHSLAVSPWGEVLVDLKEASHCAETVLLDKNAIKQVRENIPVHKHTKPIKL